MKVSWKLFDKTQTFITLTKFINLMTRSITIRDEDHTRLGKLGTSSYNIPDVVTMLLDFYEENKKE